MFKILSFILFFLIGLESCSVNPIPIQQYCEKIETLVKNPILEDIILNWFDENFHNKLISDERDYYYGGMYVPGRYTYQKPFDWDILNFEKHNSTIKLIKILETERGSQILASVSSISIAERSRASILVQSTDSENFGLDKNNKFVREITDRLAVYCLDVDS